MANRRKVQVHAGHSQAIFDDAAERQQPRFSRGVDVDVERHSCFGTSELDARKMNDIAPNQKLLAT
jgi:hypothetical protein